MKIVNRGLYLVLMMGMAASCGPAVAAEPSYNALELPYNAEDKAQLFVDQLLVRQADRVWFTQHQGKKHPENPLLIADRPWEGWRLELFGTVLYDEQEKIFKMWYMPQPGGAARRNKYFDDIVSCVTCYATSKDGIHWEKPLVGTLPSKNGKPHNAVGDFYQANVIKEMHEPDPARRYKAIGWTFRKPDRYITLTSPDGLNWTKLKTSTIISDNGDVICVFWDHRRDLYVGLVKTGETQTRGLYRRLTDTVTSKDLDHWSARVLSMKVDRRDDVGALARIEQVRPLLKQPDAFHLMRSEYYGVGVYLAESCTIGFPWILSVNNDSNVTFDGVDYVVNDGPQEIQLAVSRDLMNWERPFRTPLIEIGQLGQWDASYQSTASQAIRVGDEIRLYYSGGNYTHASTGQHTFSEEGKFIGRNKKHTGSIGLVTWKLDRFVSADGPAEGGTLTTVPMRFSGNRLVLNAATKAKGKVVVEILDAAGRPLEGFPPSAPFAGDDLRHVVMFAGKSDVSKLVGRPVTLKFHLSNASLYSFAFRKQPVLAGIMKKDIND